MGQAPGSDRPGPGVAITPEGWFVTDVKPFRRLVDHPPPRPRCFLHLLRADARHWKVVAFWVVGGGLLAWAVVTHEWIMAVPGVLVLATWARMFRATLADLRHCPLLIGVIEALGPPPHGLLGDHATACAWLADGQEIRVVLPIRLGRVCLEGSGRAEVLVLDNPQALWSCVIGARPLGRPSWMYPEGGCIAEPRVAQRTRGGETASQAATPQGFDRRHGGGDPTLSG